MSTIYFYVCLVPYCISLMKEEILVFGEAWYNNKQGTIHTLDIQQVSNKPAYGLSRHHWKVNYDLTRDATGSLKGPK